MSSPLSTLPYVQSPLQTALCPVLSPDCPMPSPLSRLTYVKSPLQTALCPVLSPDCPMSSPLSTLTYVHNPVFNAVLSTVPELPRSQLIRHTPLFTEYHHNHRLKTKNKYVEMMFIVHLAQWRFININCHSFEFFIIFYRQLYSITLFCRFLIT